jgi:hypothetical protein
MLGGAVGTLPGYLVTGTGGGVSGHPTGVFEVHRHGIEIVNDQYVDHVTSAVILTGATLSRRFCSARDRVAKLR